MQDSPSQTTPPYDAELRPLPVEDWPSFDHIQTEDGAPVDSVFSEKQMRLLTEPLYSCWKTERPFVALANVGLFYGIDIPPLVPDALLSVDVRMPENIFPKLNRSYFVWKYGKPPEVAIEVVSNREGGEDTKKLERYANSRIASYVIYDPELHLSKEPLRLYRLVGSKLVADATRPCQFSDVGLGLTIWNGRFEDTDGIWLRWTDLHGVLIPTGREQAQVQTERAVEATQRAAEATQRAVEESQRAEELTRQNQSLRELLRQHDIDPEATGSQ